MQTISEEIDGFITRTVMGEQMPRGVLVYTEALYSDDMGTQHVALSTTATFVKDSKLVETDPDVWKVVSVTLSAG